MAGRTRTTKKLAQRIDLNYFKKLGGIPYWRRVLSAALTAIGLAWLGWHAVKGNAKPYDAGPLGHAHSMLSQKCSVCHMPRPSAMRPDQGFWKRIWIRFHRVSTDEACVACHDGPEHHTEQTLTPGCSVCHVEHRGAMRLASTSDRACTQCHDKLAAHDKSPPKVAVNIGGFNSKHPEFAAVRPGRQAPRTVVFNHLEHFKKGLRGPGGTFELKCFDCHRPPGTSERLRFGTAAPPSPSLSTTPWVWPRGDYMTPVNYMEHCSGCHPLPFDDRIHESAPHKKPDVVYNFIVDKLMKYIAANPGDLYIVPEPRLPRRPLPAAPRNAQEWISKKVEDSQLLIWPECRKCHDLDRRSRESLPVVTRIGSTRELTDTTIPVRRMPSANFDHEAHQMLTCTECHATPAKSEKNDRAADLTLPGIDICRQCHQAGNDKAEARCFECHTYHDWRKQKHVEGKFAALPLIR